MVGVKGIHVGAKAHARTQVHDPSCPIKLPTLAHLRFARFQRVNSIIISNIFILYKTYKAPSLSHHPFTPFPLCGGVAGVFSKRALLALPFAK